MKYRFAIDESGSFLIKDTKAERSFVCGILVSMDEKDLKKAYQNSYSEMGYGDKVPESLEDLIGAGQFHFSKLSLEQKEVCEKKLLPLADKIYISEGRPDLLANNQHWWLEAVVCIISEMIVKEHFEKRAEIEVLIDYRHEKTWGILKDKDEDKVEFQEYHKNLERCIKDEVSLLASAKDIGVEVKFKSDTRNLFVNLADVVCGCYRQKPKVVQLKVSKVSCRRYRSNKEPYSFSSDYPLFPWISCSRGLMTTTLMTTT